MALALQLLHTMARILAGARVATNETSVPELSPRVGSYRESHRPTVGASRLAAEREETPAVATDHQIA